MKYSLALAVILSSIFSLSAFYIPRPTEETKTESNETKTEANEEPLYTTQNPIEQNFEELNPNSKTNYEGRPKTTMSEETKDENMEEQKDKANDIPRDDVTSNEEQNQETAGNNQEFNTPNKTNAIPNDDIPYNDEPKVLPKTKENEEDVEQVNENEKRTPNDDEQEMQDTEENKELNEIKSKANGTNNGITKSVQNIKMVPKIKENEIAKSGVTSSHDNKPMSDAKMAKLVSENCPLSMVKSAVWNVFDYIRSKLEHFFDIISTT